MSGKYRAQCESNIYHIMARGTGKQIIFEDDEDRRFFGKRMRQYLVDNQVELFAWCFMSNHIHLLLHAELPAISKAMRSLLTSYAMYFNGRHGRTGHMFQNRFESVPVETDEQLMVTVRYIHRNPSEDPGLSYSDYRWSSYREYLGQPFITRTDFVMRLFNGLEDFISFHESWQPEPQLEQESSPAHKRFSDEEAIRFAREVLGVDSVSSISALDKPARDHALARLKASGLTVAQVARITGIGRNIVQRA